MPTRVPVPRLPWARTDRVGGVGPERRLVVPGPDGSWGNVVALFGRYVVGRVDLLTRERFKSLGPMTGSPFAVAGEPDPAMQHHVDGDGVTGRGRMEVCKDLQARLADSGAHYLVVDNSAALLRLRVINGRFYTVVAGEQSQLMDELWNDNPEAARAALIRPSSHGLEGDLKAAYDAFVRACLESFDPSRIVLVRTHVPRFWVTEEGLLAPTGVHHRDAVFLEQLDTYFAEQTGCRVSDATLGHFPTSRPWHSVNSDLRVAIEDDLVRLIMSPPDTAEAPRAGGTGLGRRKTAARHVVHSLTAGQPVARKWLRSYFARGGASYDDLLALAYLAQERPGEYDRLVRTCVRRAVADPHSHALAVTRHRFDRSIQALRAWKWRSVRLPRGDLWRPQIVVYCGDVVLRFHRNGAIERVQTETIAEADAPAVVEGRLPVTPRNLRDFLRSWSVYFERGRRSIVSAPRMTVTGAEELVDSCYWIDWPWVLDNETIVITKGDGKAPRARREPRARTDLSFIFDPRTRIGTVGGGLMDQVTHIALFDELCSPHGLELYLDDFRYTWWRSHNGFEASRLAPELESRRMSRRISPALLERFRTEVTKTRLPWVFNQSRAWYELGLREAFVVTRDYFNARRLVEIGPDFPFLVYPDDSDLAEHVRTPPRPVTFFTTQHRIAIHPSSAEPLRRIFSYAHLEKAGLDPEVAETAAVLKATPHVAFHVRRGDYMNAHFDTEGWFSRQEHYIDAVEHLIETEIGTSAFDVAVFSDDLEFVEEHAADYGLDRVTGRIRFIRGNRHYDSIFDSYLMSLCPVIVGSVGFFAATTSLLADPPSTFIRARPAGVHVAWRREA